MIAKLADALSSSLKTEAAVKAFNGMGFVPGAGNPGLPRQRMEDDMQLFTTVVRERNLKFD